MSKLELSLVGKGWQGALEKIYENLEAGNPLSEGFDKAESTPPTIKEVVVNDNIDPILGDISLLKTLCEKKSNLDELEEGQIAVVKDAPALLITKCFVSQRASTVAFDEFGLNFGWLYRKYRTLENPTLLALHQDDWRIVRDYVTGKRDIRSATKITDQVKRAKEILQKREEVINDSGWVPLRVPVLLNRFYYQIMFPKKMFEIPDFSIYNWQFLQ